MSTAKYRNFHTGLNLFVLINILSQLIVPFSEMYSAVLEKADHPLSSAVHEFWTVFFRQESMKFVRNIHYPIFIRGPF